MGGAVTMQGADALADSARDAGAQLVDLADAHSEAGALLLARVDAATPRLSGFLASSQAVTVDATGPTVTAAAPYAGYVHARNPWAVRALDAATGELIDLYAAAGADVVDTIRGA